MNNLEDVSSDSDLEDFNWSLKKRKLCSQINPDIAPCPAKSIKIDNGSILEKNKRFEDLRKKSEHIRTVSAHRSQITENRRAKRLIKKALRDPFVKKLVEKQQRTPSGEQSTAKKEEEEWKEVKPYLNVNSHLQGPVSHGEWGPKNEVESLIDKAIEEGDFEKAEVLSDTLANKQFAGKICKAFAAKKQYEKLEKQKIEEKAKQMKKIRWTFEAKEKWQMKGNM